MNEDQVRELYKISKASIRLAESIDQEIKKQEIDKNSSSYVEELTEIKANLQLLLQKEASMKEVFGTEWQDLTLPEEFDIGDPTTSNSTYEGKVVEILRTCRNNLAILTTTSTTSMAEDEIVVLESIIQNQKNINERVQNLLTKFTQLEEYISSEDYHDSDDDLPCTYGEEIHDQLEQENPELFDIMYASPFSPDEDEDEDAVAICGYRLSIVTKLISEYKRKPIENKNLVTDDDDDDVEGLDDEHIIHNMMKLEHETLNLISDPKENALRRNSFIYFVNAAREFRFRKNTVYVAMLTLHKFLQVRVISKKRLKLLPCACLCLAVKMNQRMYKQVKPLLNDVKSRGMDGESIGRMELSISKALDWKIHVITPFFFTAFFLARLCAHYALADSKKEEIRMKSDKIIMNVVQEGSRLIYDPSQIALGAILLAMDDSFTVEDFEALSVEIFFNLDALFECYNALRALMKGPIYFCL